MVVYLGCCAWSDALWVLVAALCGVEGLAAAMASSFAIAELVLLLSSMLSSRAASKKGQNAIAIASVA